VTTPNSTVTTRNGDAGAAAAVAEQAAAGSVGVDSPDVRTVHPVAPAVPVGDSTVSAPQTWLPVSEAAERTSVSESALRKWIKAGELGTRDAPGPRGLRTEVTVEAVVSRARQAGIDASPRAGLDLADAFTRLENLTGQLIAMSDRAARAEVERDHLRRRLDELKAEQSSALEGERRRVDGERARADQLGSELGSSREALIAERARADAMLAAVPRRKRHLFDRPASGLPGDHTVPAPAAV
jgi:hypothetical protein